ncbi:hypothetical protein HHK36_024674 [Tetracentron sinense]|uniref:Uncharacterized protein n=1 Tax=Tetracentron sinense TaxID=13715 RepID=A0A835D6X6_TETSI|nr:hypothetical protein HHK36_024674 [Tetracentron sinense]
MDASINPLVIRQVISDVDDMFFPIFSISVHYGSMTIYNGCEVKPSISRNPPVIRITGNANDLYTLVMTDPDAPTPANPTERELLHWIVVDIPGGSDPSQGNEIVPYMDPRPQLGIHGFVFVLFQQTTPLPSVELPTSRFNFNTRAFADKLGLGLPVAGIYFNARGKVKGPKNKSS